jgi:cell division septation protein DedD
MLPIGPSTSESGVVPQGVEPRANPDRENPAPVREERRRLSRIYIATILAAGLLVAAGYVGTRIFAGKSHRPGTVRNSSSNEVRSNPASSNPAAPAVTPAVLEEAQTPEHPAPPTATPAVEAQAAVPTAQEPAPSAAEGFATPEHGERYLQVAALSTPAVMRYVDELRRSQLQAVVAPGPRPGIARILIGPFSDRESLESVRARLQMLGVSPFVRSY